MFAKRQADTGTAEEFRDKSVRPATLVPTQIRAVQQPPEAKVVYPNQPSQRSQ